MEFEANVGKVRFKVSDLEKEESKTLYKVSCRQRLQNIMVDCEYFEGKLNPETGSKDVSFMVTIRAFGKHPGETYYYDIYANPNRPEYNHITRCVKDWDREIKPGSKDADKLSRFINIIYSDCDKYIIDFVYFTLQNMDNPRRCNTTPIFVKSAIATVKSAVNTNTKAI